MTVNRFARAVIVTSLMLLCSLSAIDVIDDDGTPTFGPTLLGGEFAGGSGTVSDPYQISNVHELQNMSLDLDAHYVLVNDIDASTTTGWDLEAGFEPVGSRLNSFNGSLNGMNHTITGLFINRSNTNYTGLFGFIDARGSVKNVDLAKSVVTGRTYVGGLAGSAQGTVFNTRATGNVDGDNCVGGLVGYVYYGTVNNSYSTGNVTGSSTVGGLAGRNLGTVSNSHATGNVSGNGYIGGVVGLNSNAEVSNCYSTGNVTGTEHVGGLVGYDNGGAVSNSHYNIDDILINGGHHITTGGLFNTQYRDWHSRGLSLDISEYSTYLVPSGEYYDVTGVQGLRDLLGFADNTGYKFRLAADVDLSAAPGLYVPYISAEFDGTNRTISGLRVDMPFADNLGMFGVIERKLVENVRLVDADVTGNFYVGGLVGHNEGTVSNCLATGNVTGRLNSGGLVGYNDNTGKVYSSRATCNVTGVHRVGGLVGLNINVVSDSHAAGSVTGNTSVGGLVGVSRHGRIVSSSCTAGVVVGNGGGVGGLVGYNEWAATVEGSHATVDVEGTSGGVGGLVGWSYSSTVSDSFATGNVSGDDYLGGLVGWMDYRDRVSRSYATGNVSGIDSIAGGLVGYHHQSTVEDSYASGNVIRSSGTGTLLGGFVGFNDGDISRCYSTGKVTYAGAADPNDKGFAGGDSGTFEMTGNFWDNQTSLQTATSGNATGMDTMEMRTRSTFADAGWDFDLVWCMIENVTYPLLRWQDREAPTAEAGPDQVINETTSTIFNGSNSIDDIGVAEYRWTFEDEGFTVLFGVRPTYHFENPGIYIVTLKVTDALGNWDTDTMTVTVNDTTPPIADAGPDQTVDEDEPVILDAGGSSDNVGIVNWTWLIRKPVWLDDPYWYYYNKTITLWLKSPGTHTIYLTVRDAAGNVGYDEVNVTVLDVLPPRANAGPDQKVDEGTTVKFYGGNSYDSGRIENSTWTFNYNTEELAIFGKEVYFTFDLPGTYVVTLKVTDFAGHSSIDTLNITVVDVTPPLVDAGPDQTVDEGAVVTFEGGGSWDSGGITNYTWSFDTGIGPVLLYGVLPSYTFDMPGVFVVTLNVTDAAGHWGEDTLTVTVRDRTPPVADAGPDRVVPIGTTVELNGSLSVDNGILAFSWDFTYDGEPRALAGEAARFTFNRAGVYEVVLTVTDAFENSDDDTVVVTVVDTGRVTGTVLDQDGRLVKGALVNIVASDGSVYSAMTMANGSFAEEVHYGPFTWRVLKSGYRGISGSSSVDAMGKTELDLSGDPLVKEDDGGQSMTTEDWSMVVVVMCVVAIVALVALRRMRSGSHPR